MANQIKKFLQSFWGGAIAVIFVIILGYYFWGTLSNGGIVFTLTGPGDVKSGETGEFHFKYENNSRLSLEDCSIEMNLPDGVILREDPVKRVLALDLGSLSSKASGDKTVELVIAGEPKTIKSLEATFNYRPRGISSSFSKKSIKEILLSGSHFNLDIHAPKQVFVDQIFPLEINWMNLSQQTFENIELRVEWPTGFSLESSQLEIIEANENGNSWTIGAAASSSQGKIDVQAAISGRNGETKRIILTLGTVQDHSFLVLAKTEGFLNLIANPLKISSFVNGDVNYNADLGENLDFVINYENNYSASLRNLTITAQLNGDVFDFSTLKAPKGLFSTRKQTITWTEAGAKELYNLNPGDSGTLNFSIKLKKDWPMQSLAQKNIILEAQIAIASANAPEELGYQGLAGAKASNTIKLSSHCSLSVESYFWDAPSKIANTGKLPLKVEEPTDFTIHWKIINTYNDINDVAIKTALPLWADWTNQVSGNYGETAPVYNANNRQITWAIENVPLGSGSVSKAYEAIFQVRVTPMVSQVNQSVDLIKETILTGTDAFTLTDIYLTYPAVSSYQLTDKAVSADDGIVGPRQ